MLSVQLAGENVHDCGYCKRKDESTSISYGFLANEMSVKDYEMLMLIGWRRSGKYFYKPTMHRTCCPAYTIRLSVKDFKENKSQKKIVRRFYSKVNKSNEIDDANQIVSTNLSTFKTTIEPASFSVEKYNLYKKYQVNIHHDEEKDISEASFTRFLVDSPLRREEHSTSSNGTSSNGTSSNRTSSNGTSYGSFHQLYRLNNKLIAVGVLDVLSSGVSSVYFFYDSDYKHLVLGKFSALEEIQFCRDHQLPYYYMGFYIHTCEKMKYKGEYQPSDLLCPTTLKWFLFQDVIDKIEQFRFTPFDSEYFALRSTMAITDESSLSMFAPKLESIVQNVISIEQIKLNVGMKQYVYLHHLPNKAQEVIRRMLEEFVSLAAPIISDNLVVQLV